MPKPIIKTQGLGYTYAPGTPVATVALRDVNVEIEEGTFVGLIGHTGSGKSTFITHLNGLIKPTEGKVFIDGTDIWENPQDIRRFRFMVGLVFQYPEYQLFEETVYKDIAFGPKNMKLDEKEVDKRVRQAAALCQIPEELFSKSPFELSGGQKRRVAIAGVMAMQPKVLVLDEPAAGLDPESRNVILGEIKEYHKATGATVILVSHSMEDIATYADKVLVMAEGTVVMYDTTEAVFGRAKELVAMGLSVPQITSIFLRLKEMGVDIETDVYTMDYAVRKVLKHLGITPAKSTADASGSEIENSAENSAPVVGLESTRPDRSVLDIEKSPPVQTPQALGFEPAESATPPANSPRSAAFDSKAEGGDDL